MPIDKEKAWPKEQENPIKEPYATPELTIHGDVEEITRAIAPGAEDGDMGSFPTMEP